MWGVGGDNDPKDTLQGFLNQMGVTFPVLYDEDKVVQSSLFSLELAIHSVYPSDWIIGVDGQLVYVNNEFDAEELHAVIQAELAKMDDGDDSD